MSSKGIVAQLSVVAVVAGAAGAATRLFVAGGRAPNPDRSPAQAVSRPMLSPAVPGISTGPRLPSLRDPAPNRYATTTARSSTTGLESPALGSSRITTSTPTANSTKPKSAPSSATEQPHQESGGGG